MGTCGLRCAAIVLGVVSACTSGGSDTSGASLFVAIHGAGSVTSSPAGLACDGDACTLAAPPGTVVTLAATADADNLFAGWAGACTGSAPTCTVELASDTSVSASFVPASTSLAVLFAGSGAGSVTSGVGIDCTDGGGPQGCTAALAPNSVVDLTATPAAGSVFSYWGGGCAGSEPTCVTTIGSDLDTVTARFDPISVAVAETGQGTITATPGDIACIDNTGTCTATFSGSTHMTLMATPAAGWAFANWDGACAGLNAEQATCYATIDGPTTIGALFTEVPGTFSVVLAGNGSGQVVAASSACSDGTCFDCPTTGCSVTLDPDATVTLTETAGSDSTFAGWSAPCSGTGTCTLTAGSATTVTATFDAKPEVLTVELTGSGSGTVGMAGDVTDLGIIDCGDGGSACSATEPAGTPITLTATPSPTSQFAGWSGPCTVVSPGICDVTLHDATTVTAEFETIQYQLTVAYPEIYYLDGGALAEGLSNVWGTFTATGSDGSNLLACDMFTATCSATLPIDTQVTLTAAPAGSADFRWWSDVDGACSGSATTCTFTLTTTTQIDAVFSPVPIDVLTVSDDDIGQGIAVSIEDTSGETSIDTCEYACSYFIGSGTTVDLYGFPPSADTDDYFEAWSSPCFSSDPSCAVTLSGDTTEAESYVYEDSDTDDD